MTEKFPVTYHCGCVHELERDTSKGAFMFRPTGSNQDCDYHKNMEEN